MKTATGIHITSQTLRRVTLEQTGDMTSVTHLTEDAFDAPLTADAIARDQEIRDALLDHIPQRDAHPVAICLPGGLFHIQKVPLEMASAEDRREQIVWEASQALVADVEAYDIDFLPSGRVAFWTAMRSEIREALADGLAANGFDQTAFLVEPISLFHALQLCNTADAPRRAAIYWNNPWLSFAAQEHGALIAAETVHVCAAQDAPQQILIEQQIRHWILGDFHAERHSTIFDRVYLCGTPAAIQLIRARLPDVDLTELPVFDPLCTDPLPPTEAHHLDLPESFSIAAGSAFAQLAAQE